MTGFDARRTQVAQSAFDFSAYFTQSFGRVRVNGAIVRRPELVAPEGMSTAGGKRARQPICLQPEGGAGPVLTIGWVDIPQRRAVLRTFRCLHGMHMTRYRGRAFDLDQDSYNAFFDQAKGLLANCGLVITEEDDAPASGRESMASVRPPPGAAEVDIGEGRGVAPPIFLYAAIALVSFVLGAVAGGLAVYARVKGF